MLFRSLRREVPHLDEDRALHPDQQAAMRLIRSGAVTRAAGRDLPALCA